MDIMVIVNESPWGSSIASTAMRFVQAAHLAGNRVVAIFFKNDGIYNAQSGSMSDDGLISPANGWCEIGREKSTPLLLCPAASARRFDQALIDKLPKEFRQAGLLEMWAIAQDCDRVVTF